jgi:hypothetical protein
MMYRRYVKIPIPIIQESYAIPINATADVPSVEDMYGNIGRMLLGHYFILTEDVTIGLGADYLVVERQLEEHR